MPRLTHRLPVYCRHKASGQAVVTLDGKDFYLGPHGSKVSRDEYDRLITEWLAGRRRLPEPESQGAGIAVVELIADYLDYAQVYYRKPDGTHTTELCTLQQALKPLNRLYGRAPATDFGPLALKAVRQAMLGNGWCRSHINKQVSRIKSMFRWAVENERVPASIHHALLAVKGLARGRCDARESKPVRPVVDSWVDAIKPFVSRQVWAMIELQLHTGMRPGEVVIMRGADLDTGGEIWVYTPAYHKTEHHGLERRIYLGPRAQETIRPFLKLDSAAYLFSPQEAEGERRQRAHSQRKTPLSCGNRPSPHRRRKSKRTPDDRYGVDAYRRAIARACDEAFPPHEFLRRRLVDGQRGHKRWETPAEWKMRLGPKHGAELIAWQQEHRWHPHQLRHNAATRLRKQFGIDVARVVLGHRSAAVTEIYAELDHAKAADVMKKIG